MLFGISAGLSSAERRNRWNLRPLYSPPPLPGGRPLYHLIPRPHPAVGSILTPRRFLLSCIPPFCLPLPAVSAWPSLCDPVQSGGCQRGLPLDELRAMICRKWRGSEKEKKKKKKIGAARHELYTDRNRE